MLLPGLLSVTFRKLQPNEIIDLVRNADLDGIEWGGDIHVPHGDHDRAKEVRRKTEEAGLQVFAYGSYYRSVSSEDDGLSFNTVLETAIALGAPIIRVWAGKQGSSDSEPDYRSSIADNLRSIGEAAQSRKVEIALEFHGNTLTDTVDSALSLIEEVAHPNVKLYWQPPHAQSTETRLQGLRRILPYLSHLHAFHWDTREGKLERKPLSEGKDDWRAYLRAVDSPSAQRAVMLEFVRDHSPDQFLKDAETLKRLVQEATAV